MSDDRSFPGPSSSSWPTRSSRLVGRIRSARGADDVAGCSRLRFFDWTGDGSTRLDGRASLPDEEAGALGNECRLDCCCTDGGALLAPLVAVGCKAPRFTAIGEKSGFVSSSARSRRFSSALLFCRHASTCSSRFSARTWRLQIGHSADAMFTCSCFLRSFFDKIIVGVNSDCNVKAEIMTGFGPVRNSHKAYRSQY